MLLVLAIALLLSRPEPTDCIPIEDVVQDCNSNLVAESCVHRRVCATGKAVFYWHDENGDLHVTIHWSDADGKWWIKERDAKHDRAGNLVVEPNTCE